MINKLFIFAILVISATPALSQEYIDTSIFDNVQQGVRYTRPAPQSQQREVCHETIQHMSKYTSLSSTIANEVVTYRFHRPETMAYIEAGQEHSRNYLSYCADYSQRTSVSNIRNTVRQYTQLVDRAERAYLQGR